MVTVVFYTVYTQMIEVFETLIAAHSYIAAVRRHFTLAEIYKGGALVDSLRLA